MYSLLVFFFFSSRRRHTRWTGDWSSDVCSSDLPFSFKNLGMLASLGNRSAVAEIMGVRVSGFIAWVLWRAIYLSKLPTLARKVEVMVDWAWTALFPPNIVQLPMSRTGAVGLARYAAGEFIFHKGDPIGNVFGIQSGTAGVYLDESAQPTVIHHPGE